MDTPPPSPTLPPSLRGHLLVAAAGSADPNFGKTVVLIVRHTLRLPGLDPDDPDEDAADDSAAGGFLGSADAGDSGDDLGGAFGLVLNRPAGLSVGDAIRAGADPAGDPFLEILADDCPGADAPLHLGGPCGGPLMALHELGADEPADDWNGTLPTLPDPNDPADAANDFGGPGQVAPGVWYTAFRPRVEDFLHRPGTRAGARIKYFGGYAGWAPGQLEAEILAGGWLVCAAAPSDVFADAGPTDSPPVGPPAGEAQWSRLSARLTLSRWIEPDRIPDDPSVN